MTNSMDVAALLATKFVALALIQIDAFAWIFHLFVIELANIRLFINCIVCLNNFVHI